MERFIDIEILVNSVFPVILVGIAVVLWHITGEILEKNKYKAIHNQNTMIDEVIKKVRDKL